jgi:hypothetical protein
MKSTHENGGDMVETDFIRVIFQKGIPADVGINGCRIEDVIRVSLDRLLEFQKGPLACIENEEAIQHLLGALQSLNERVRRRQLQGVFNSMSPHYANRTEDLNEDFSATGS